MEWNRRNIIVAVVILILGFGGGGAMYLYQKGGTQGGMAFMWFRLEKWADGLDGVMTEMTPMEIREAKKKAEKVAEIALQKYPELRIEDKPVPREQNGFYAMLELAEDPRLGGLRKIDFYKLLSGDPVDLDQLRKELEPFEEIGLEIERVAAMPERSSSDVPAGYEGMVPAGQVKAMVEYLLSKALLSAGNEDEAFRYVYLAMNLSDHLRYIESPNLLSETVLILCRLNIMDSVIKDIFPQLGNSANLEKWSRLIEPRRDIISQRHAELLKGELAFFNDYGCVLVFNKVPDPKELILARHKMVHTVVAELEGMDLKHFSHWIDSPPGTFSRGLSAEGAAIIGMFGSQTWARGVIRPLVGENLYEAALDLLIREKAGEDLSRLSETYVLNPYTEKPFKYDPATRTLEEVSESEGGEIEPLKLPW